MRRNPFAFSRRRLSLPVVFAVAGALVFLIAGALLGWMSTERSIRQLVQMAESGNAALARALANALEPADMEFLARAGSLFAAAARPAAERGDSLPHARAALRADPAQMPLARAVRRTVAGTDVVKVKLYDPAGLTVFSSDARQIGDDKRDNPGFRAAIGGGVVSELTFRDKFDAFEGTIADRDLLSSYVPLRGDGVISGVFEIYTDVTGLRAEIHRNMWHSLALVGGSFLLVYLLLLLVVVRGSRLLQREHAHNLRLAAAMARAENASRAKSDFLMHMSHELRTPLNAVIGFAEMIENGVMGEAVGRYREYGSDIRSAGVHLLAIIDEILELTILESDAALLVRTDVDAGELITSLARTLEPVARRAGLTLRTAIDADLPPVSTDRTKLLRALRHLADNAIKFSMAGGEVVLTAQRQPAGDGVDFRLIDRGIGIAAADLPLCFAPFGQAAGVQARRHGGVGLGLSLADRYVQVLGGQLRLVSEPGHGTEVTLFLPLVRRPARADLATAVAA